MSKWKIEDLRRWLRYDGLSGKLYWNPKLVQDFSESKYPLRSVEMYNAKYAGKLALNAVNAKGYRYGTMNRKQALAHRVIFAIVHGHLPDGQIDHINGDPSDNRISNLRAVSASDNSRNTSIRADNKSGAHGVLLQKCGKYRVQICREYLGMFEDLEDAVAARKNAEARYGFHPNHGRPKNG